MTVADFESVMTVAECESVTEKVFHADEMKVESSCHFCYCQSVLEKEKMPFSPGESPLILFLIFYFEDIVSFHLLICLFFQTFATPETFCLEKMFLRRVPHPESFFCQSHLQMMTALRPAETVTSYQLSMKRENVSESFLAVEPIRKL